MREAVINALVHADYSQRGAPIRISFFDDRIEIENPGILLPGMTLEDMRQGVSKIRNHVIARVFRELNLIEQWGSGVRRIFKEAQEQGLPEPQIMEVGMRVRVKLLGHKSVSGELHKQIKRLLALGMIEMTLPEKPNSRLQKYRLTVTGRDLVAADRIGMMSEPGKKG